MNLGPYIKELISLNECIILPGFGGFETSYQPAEFDTASMQMLPPSKNVEFKPDYVSGGEILENHLSLKLGVDKVEAKQIIEDYISSIKHELEKNKLFEISGVGKFNGSPSGQINFTPYKDEPNLAESFGLEPLEIDSKVEPPKVATKPIVPTPRIRPKKNTLTFVIIGIITISLLLLFTVLIASKFEIYLFNIGDQVSENDEMLILGNNFEKDSTYVSYEEKLDDYTSVKNALQYKEPETPLNTVRASSFVIVAGSFKAYNYAEELKTRLNNNGFSAEIVEAGGYYRVSMGRFTDKSEALTELHRIRTQIDRSVWLLALTGTPQL